FAFGPRGVEAIVLRFGGVVDGEDGRARAREGSGNTSEPGRNFDVSILIDPLDSESLAQRVDYEESRAGSACFLTEHFDRNSVERRYRTVIAEVCEKGLVWNAQGTQPLDER